MRPDPVFPTPAIAPDALRDRFVVVTGATDGIGLALAEQCVQAGAHVVMVGRNPGKTQRAAEAVSTRTGSTQVSIEIADLLHLDEQVALAERLRRAHPTIHALVNNAGALFLDREVTRDGLERTFALNHVAYVSLAVGLLPSLLAGTSSAVSGASGTAPARIINVSSRAHRQARLDMDDLQLTRGYSGWKAYSRSKLANVLATRALASRLPASRVVVQAVHPGLVASRFAADNGWLGRLQRWIMDLASVSPSAGADTAAWLLTCREATDVSGAYWVRRAQRRPSDAACDTALGEALWQATIRLASLDTSPLEQSAIETSSLEISTRPTSSPERRTDPPEFLRPRQ